MRVLFFLVFVSGLLLAFAYPAAVDALSGRVVATSGLYSEESGFAPAEIDLSAEQAPIRIDVEIGMAANRAAAVPQNGRLLLQVTRTGRPVLDSSLGMRVFEKVGEAAGSAAPLLRAEAGVIDTVATGHYRFEMAERGDVTQAAARIDIILRANALQTDRRAIPLGYVLAAVGLIGLIIATMRRRSARKTATRSNPRWGRGAGD